MYTIFCRNWLCITGVEHASANRWGQIISPEAPMRRGRGAFHINHQLVINIIILLMRIVVIINIDEDTGQEGI